MRVPLGYFFTYIIIAFLSVVSPSVVQAQTSDELYDYLVQDVCTDAAGNIVANDPANAALCQNRRNILLGEKSPYILTDRYFLGSNDPKNGATYQAINSIPVRATDGTIKIFYPKIIQGPFSSSYQFTSFVESRDGLDLADITNSNYVSFIRTSDGTCYDQIWSKSYNYASPVQRAGGWIIFPYAGIPSSWAPINSVNVATYHVQLTPNRPNCANGNSTGVTYWNSPFYYQYNSGKILNTLVSAHYASTNLSSTNNALERYFFTKEYGFTKWEAWVPQTRCINENMNNGQIAKCYPGVANYLAVEIARDVAGRCNNFGTPETGESSVAQWGYQNWVRIDCRDLTNFIALDTPIRLLTSDMANTNGVVDINYLASTNVWNGNGPQSYHNMGSANGTGWQVPSSAGAGHLTYGPYVSGLPAGLLTARFKLKVDNNIADNKNVVTVEVYRYTDNHVFGTRTITRREFLAANAAQEFTLPFYYDGVGALEFRVYVHGNSYVSHEQSSVG